VKPVTDGNIVSFYEANQGRMQGRSLDQMREAIRRYLEEQGQANARAAFVAELRKSAPPLRTLIDAPRRQVDITPTDPTKGPASAPVTIVEFSDYQCPFCARVNPTLDQIRAAYGNRVRVVWKDFPLTSIHPEAFKGSEAAHCAGDQGKYWEYHDRLFENQRAMTPADLKRHATDLGLDMNAFNACLDSSKYAERVRAGMDQGTKLGVSSTPALFINGRIVTGAQPYEAFAAIIDDELQRASQR
jgi:protein-disulfide isomerase